MLTEATVKCTVAGNGDSSVRPFKWYPFGVLMILKLCFVTSAYRWLVVDTSVDRASLY